MASIILTGIKQPGIITNIDCHWKVVVSIRERVPILFGEKRSAKRIVSDLCKKSSWIAQSKRKGALKNEKITIVFKEKSGVKLAATVCSCDWVLGLIVSTDVFVVHCFC